VLAAQKLRKKLDVRDIESLKIESIRQAFARWMDAPEIWRPQTRETADHSLPCTVAMSLIDGTITPAMMEQDRFKADDVLELMGRCEIELPDEFNEVAPAVRSCRLTAKLKNGDTVVVEERRSLDDDVADPGWDHAVEKFRGLTADLFSADAAGALIAAVDALDRAPSLTQLIAATRIG